MPKMKTKKSLAKRIKKTSSGKLKRNCAYTSHLAQNKTKKQKRHLSKDKLISKADYNRIKKMVH